MAPTGKVIFKPTVAPAAKAPTGRSKQVAAAETTIDMTAAAQELNAGHRTAYLNFKKDLADGTIEVDECKRIAGRRINLLCHDKYVFYPGDKTYTQVSNHLGLKAGELGRLGFLRGEGGSPNIAQPLFPMKFDKAYLDGVMAEHQAIAGIEE